MPTQVLPAQIPEKAVAIDTISLTEYNNIADSISELIGRSSRNLLVNGGFEVWQRGTGSFTADQAYSADRWMLFKSGGSTITVTQETSTVATNSRRSLKAVTTLTTCGVQQKVEDGYALRGKTVAIAMRVHQSVASGARLVVSDDVGNTATASYSATTGSFVTLTTTLAVGATATYLTVTVYFDLAGTYYLDNAMLVLGPNPTEYVPLHPQQDLARCQRYYEILTFELQGYNTAGNFAGYLIPFRVPKGGTPTVTKNGTWGTVTNCGQPAVASRTGSEEHSVFVYTTVTASAAFACGPTASTQFISVEWNP